MEISPHAAIGSSSSKPVWYAKAILRLVYRIPLVCLSVWTVWPPSPGWSGVRLQEGHQI